MTEGSKDEKLSLDDVLSHHGLQRRNEIEHADKPFNESAVKRDGKGRFAKITAILDELTDRDVDNVASIIGAYKASKANEGTWKDGVKTEPLRPSGGLLRARRAAKANEGTWKDGQKIG